MNEPQVILACIPCLFWNLIVPALAWALVIAGLTWTIRDRIRSGDCDAYPEKGLTENCQDSGEKVLVNQPLDSCILCYPIAGNQLSKRGEETCTQKK